MIEDIASCYNFCLHHYYYTTQSLCGGVFALLGDTIVQTNERFQLQERRKYHEELQKEEQGEQQQRVKGNEISSTMPIYDTKRSVVYFLKGLGGGIVWAYWFEIADVWARDLTTDVMFWWNQYVGGTNETFQRVTQTIVSILLEQFVVCPLLYTFWDIPITSLLRGSPARQIPLQVKEKLGPLLVANAQVWTLVNVITYNIPLDLRVLFTSVGDIIWQTINASITSKDIQIPPPPELVTGTMDMKLPNPAIGGSAGTINLVDDRRLSLDSPPTNIE
jgi:hypothetical protein